MSCSLFPFSLEGDSSHDLNIYLIQMSVKILSKYQSRSTQITIWFVSRKVRSLALAYTCLLHGMKLSFLCKSRSGKGQLTFSILLSLFSLPAITARCITNPSWGLFLRDSAIKLQKQSNPSSWAKNWQQMSTNPVDHAHISPQGAFY